MEEIIGILVILALIILILKDRKNIKREGIVFIRRSKFFVKNIEKFGTKHEKIFNIFGNISVVIGFLISLFSLYFLITLLFIKVKAPAIQIILPSLPGICESNIFLCLNPIYWIVIILIVAFSHEIMHAMLSEANKVKIKSVGYAIFIFLPAFFVEPNEKEFEKRKTIQKLRILSVGSIGNLLIALFTILFLFLLYFILSPFFSFYGLEVEVIPNSSAYFANLTGIILKIEGKEATIKNLREILSKKEENESILIETTEGIYKFNLTNRTIGIRIKREIYNSTISFLSPLFDYSKNFYYCFALREPAYCSFIFNSFAFLLILISIGVAIFNLLPLKPLDGGKMWEELLKLVFPKKYREISNTLSIFVFIIILLLILKPLV
jgi:membrane-associated protease RseP (regulator of RpoE activity)